MAVFERNRKHYSGFQMRCVLLRRETEAEHLRLLFCMIRACTGKKPRQVADRIYHRYSFLDRWISTKDSLGFFETLRKGKLKLDDRSIVLGERTSCRFDRPEPSFNEFCDLPGELLVVSNSGDQPGYQGSGPLLDYKLPYFRDVSSAVAEWTKLGYKVAHTRSEQGELLWFLPDLGARFAALGLRNGKLHIRVEKTVQTQLRIKGHVKIADEIFPVNFDVTRRTHSIPWHEGMGDVDLYLIGSDNWLYDHHVETPFYSRSRRRIQEEQGRAPSELLKQIQRGEGETTEFKPFLDPKDSKMNEVVKTVAAFANTKGGRVFIGVDNSCEIVGVEKGIKTSQKYQSLGFNKAVTRYSNDLLQGLNAAIDPSPNVHIEPVTVTGRKLVMIDVPESSAKPLLPVRNNMLFVRAAGTSRGATRDERRRLWTEGPIPPGPF